ncbi:efflux RND transporter periplasmic adaptor subunit [Puteibacter caeruleilacunae]|nr:efflux RND transporter periplasmic adaptor subunit [Puteibacter caeruleilacunae]
MIFSAVDENGWLFCKNKNQRKMIQNILIGLSLIAFVACNSGEAKESIEMKSEKPEAKTAFPEINFTEEQYEMAEIKTGKVEKRNLSEAIKVNGAVEIRPKGIATISAPLGGYVNQIALLEGDHVKKGQVLAIVENPEFFTIQQDYLEGISRYNYLKKEYERQQKLRDKEVNSQKLFQKVQSDYLTVKAKITALEKKMIMAGIEVAKVRGGDMVDAAQLRSPINGYVKSSNVTNGRFVDPEDALFEIIDADKVLLRLNTYEKDMGRIYSGQNVHFGLANEDLKERVAKVTLVGKAADKDRVVPVYAEIDNVDGSEMVPGTYVKAFLEVESKKQYAVPSDAVVQLDGKDLVILAKQTSQEHVFIFRQIKKGIEEGGYTAVQWPGDVNPEQVSIVTENAYAVLSAFRNMSEEE